MLIHNNYKYKLVLFVILLYVQLVLQDTNWLEINVKIVHLPSHIAYHAQH